MKEYKTNSSNETLELGQKMAKSFNTNIVGLIGKLGSGKTVFTKGIAEYFGIKNITSPSFVIMKIYSIKNPKYKFKNLLHVDCYRLKNYQSLIDIGLEDYIYDKKNLIIIEWADKIKDSLPKCTKYIRFELGKDEKQRVIEF